MTEGEDRPSGKAMVERLFEKLSSQKKRPFPPARGRLDAPKRQGVYVIRKGAKVVHVGRALGGNNGRHQRLMNHLHGASSFATEYLKRSPNRLRKGYTYQCLVLGNRRARALLEAYATGNLCPADVGLGK
jgi:hypothetical protein